MLIRWLWSIYCDPGYNAVEADCPIFEAMKLKITLRTGMVLAGILLIQACVWDNVEELYPDTPECDTSSVSFSMDITPILSNNCFSCHSKVNAPGFGGGLSFEDHADVSANSARITGAINHNEGFIPMPQGVDKLDPCSILKFEAWVSAGAPDN